MSDDIRMVEVKHEKELNEKENNLVQDTNNKQVRTIPVSYCEGHPKFNNYNSNNKDHEFDYHELNIIPEDSNYLSNKSPVSSIFYKDFKRINKTLTLSNFYADTHSGILFNTKPKEPEALCNIIFKPIKEITIYDELTIEKELEIGGFLNNYKELPIIRVNIKDLRNSDWIEQYWGFECRLYPVSRCYDKVRDAIKVLCNNIKKEIVVKQLGWYRIDTTYIYIHGGGIIGSNNIKINIHESLSNFSINKDKNLNEKASYEKALKLLKVAPLNVTIPLFSLTLLSLINTLLKWSNNEPKFCLWLEGETGSRKTTIANLFTNYYNRINGFSNPPANFKDTITSLEIKMFEFKDCPLLIDDYAPTDNPREKREIDTKVSTILRMYGDRISKARSNVKLTREKEFLPRGLGLITGEDFIGIHSSMARCICIYLNKHDVDLVKLTRRQANPLEMPTFIYYFLEWIAYVVNKNHRLPPIEIETFRANFRRNYSNEVHGRLIDAIFFLQYSYKMFLDYGLNLKILTQVEYDESLNIATNILCKLALCQQSDMQQEKPLIMYLKTLTELINTNQIVLIEKGTEYKSKNHGWYDEDFYYLMPEATFNMISKSWKIRNKEFPLSMTRLHRLLLDNDIVVPDSEPNKIVTKVKVNKTERPRVLKLKRKNIEDYLQ